MSERPKLPGSLDANRRLDRWLQFNSDRTVTVRTGKVELGQGIVTALAQIAAEELDIALSRVHMLSGDTALAPDEGTTAGSRSIEDGGSALRYACAESRHLLLQAAAEKLDIPADKLTVEDGVISGFDRIRKVSYWDLPHEQLLAREATAAIKPKPATQHGIVGTSAQRLDIPAKVTGAPRFIQDLDLPGMLFGRVVRPPSYDAQLVSFDESSVRTSPGLVAVVRDGNFVGVVADREEQAIKARTAAQRAAQWRQTPLPTDDAGIHGYIASRRTTDQVILQRGSATQGVRTLEATYTRPYIAHASMGPSCALARFENDKLEVWSHTQGVYPLRDDMARVLGMPEDKIVVHHAEGAGCYGHNGADDVALDAALLARAVQGRAVKVQWMRDDEFAWEPFGPAMAVKLRGALDARGKVADWALELWSNGHSARPSKGKPAGRTSALLAARHIAQPFDRQPAGHPSQLAGDGMSRNAPVLYDFPSEHITAHRVEELPLRVSSLRGLGAYANVFAVESFMDELAAAAGVDPVEFRLQHLKDARGRAVIELAARKSGWQNRTNDRHGDGTSGRGFAFSRYKNQAGYLALAVDVQLEPDLHVIRVVAAADVGQAINPDGIANQIEGGIIQAISWTLKEQVRFDRERVTSRSWEDYPILTFPEVPAVEVHLIDRREEEPLGAGEMAAGPAAAAVANAVYDALGVRIRDLPITRDRITAALG